MIFIKSVESFNHLAIRVTPIHFGIIGRKLSYLRASGGLTTHKLSSSSRRVKALNNSKMAMK